MENQTNKRGEILGFGISFVLLVCAFQLFLIVKNYFFTVDLNNWISLITYLIPIPLFLLANMFFGLLFKKNLSIKKGLIVGYFLVLIYFIPAILFSVVVIIYYRKSIF